jgi:hypothetical protein
VLVFLRAGVAALVLLPIAARAGCAPSVDAVRRHWRPLLVFAALERLVLGYASAPLIARAQWPRCRTC